MVVQTHYNPITPLKERSNGNDTPSTLEALVSVVEKKPKVDPGNIVTEKYPQDGIYKSRCPECDEHLLLSTAYGWCLVCPKGDYQEWLIIQR